MSRTMLGITPWPSGLAWSPMPLVWENVANVTKETPTIVPVGEKNVGGMIGRTPVCTRFHRSDVIFYEEWSFDWFVSFFDSL